MSANPRLLTDLIREEIQKTKIGLLVVKLIIFCFLVSFSLRNEMELSQARLREWQLGNQSLIEQALFLENAFYFTRFEQFEKRIQGSALMEQVIVIRQDGKPILGTGPIPEVPRGFSRTWFPLGVRYYGDLNFADKKLGEIFLRGTLPLKTIVASTLLIALFSLLVLGAVRLLLGRLESLVQKKVVLPIETLSELMSSGSWQENLSIVEGLRQKPLTFEVRRLLDGYTDLQERIRVYSHELEQVADQSARYDLARQVAHDIRSPLAALKMALNNVRGVDPEIKEILLMVAERIESIAKDLLQKYPEQLRIETTHLMKTLWEIQKEKSLEFKDRPKFSLDIVEGPTNRDALRVAVPSFELRRVLSNLINNAVEASGPDGGPVRLKISTDESLHLVVEDAGLGIAPELLAQLFVRGQTFNKIHGNGLGLHSAREIIRRYGGEVRLDSELGRGTQAILDLPLERA